MTVRLFLLCAMSAVVACGQRSTRQGATSAPAMDSLRGVVSVTGTSFDQHLVLRSEHAATALLAATPDSAALSRVGGVEVLVRGRVERGGFRVASFTAMRVEGAPVADGVLRRDGERLVLETATGWIPLGNPPAAFRAMVGARVWVAGPLDRGPNTYGIIVPAS